MSIALSHDLQAVYAYIRSAGRESDSSDSSEEEEMEKEEELDRYLTGHLDMIPEALRRSVRNICMRKEPYMRVNVDFGEEIPQYIYDFPESVENIQYSPEGEIEGISFYKLIEMMTSGATELIGVFLSTYPIYVTADEVLTALLERVRVPEPLLASTTERKAFQQSVLTVMSRKLASIMKTWVKLWPELFQLDSIFLTRVRAVLPGLEEGLSLSSGSMLVTKAKQRDRLVFSDSRVPMSPILPQELDFRGSMILAWDTTEIARQCTLIEWTYLARVEVSECLSRRWEKEGKEVTAPNIVALSKRFASARALLIDSVVYTDKDNRLKIIKKLLDVANVCLTTFYNFETPFIIATAFKSDAMQAFKKTLAQITKAHKDIQKKLASVYDSDFSAVRQEMQRQCNVPCWLALRQELAKIDIRHGDFTQTGLINLQKQKMTADVIARLKQYQSNPVQCFKVGMLYDYLEAKNFVIDELKATHMAEEADASS